MIKQFVDDPNYIIDKVKTLREILAHMFNNIYLNILKTFYP